MEKKRRKINVWLHLARPQLWPIQIFVSVTQCRISGSPCMCWELLTRQQGLYCTTLLMVCSSWCSMQTCLCHSLGRNQLPAPVSWELARPVLASCVWDLRPSKVNMRPYCTKHEQKGRILKRDTCYQNHRSWDFLTSPQAAHTASSPFTWALLTDLGLGSAYDINGSRLTEVPLQWTVLVWTHAHPYLFFTSSSTQSHKIHLTTRCNLRSLFRPLSDQLTPSTAVQPKMKVLPVRLQASLPGTDAVLLLSHIHHTKSCTGSTGHCWAHLQQWTLWHLVLRTAPESPT